jgi:uncharacterized phage-associated protein
MTFAYNPKKATQAVAYLVSLNNGQMELWRMLKLIYLFDRRSLVETGSTITGDVLDNLPHGGTPSQIYDNTKSHRDKRFKDAIWQQYLTESVNNEIRLQNEKFSTDELSEFERDLIRQTWEKFGKLSNSKLYDVVHSLPEFEDPEGSSTRIDPEEILRHEKWTDDDIARADRDAKRHYFLNQISKFAK